MRTDHARIARERLTLIHQQEQEITDLRRELAKAKAGSLNIEADAELDAFYSIKAELRDALPATSIPRDYADEVERMVGRLALLERLFAAVVDAYGPSDAADCDQVRADLKRFAELPDDALDLAEELVATLGPEPAVWLAQRLATIPAYRHTRTPREVASVLSQI